MGVPVGYYKGGKLVQIIDWNPARKLPGGSWDRRVDLSHRPDIKLGHVWGTEPDGYNVTYQIIDDQIVAITPDPPAEPAPAATGNVASSAPAPAASPAPVVVAAPAPAAPVAVVAPVAPAVSSS